jgi:hypothetical protein
LYRSHHIRIGLDTPRHDRYGIQASFGRARVWHPACTTPRVLVRPFDARGALKFVVTAPIHLL